MWAHYAANHEGVILMIESDKDKSLASVRPVEYIDTRPSTSVETVVPNLYRKARVWGYESEYRVLSTQSGARSIDRESLVGIILGARMTENSRATVVRLAAGHGPLALYQAFADDRSYRVLKSPLA